MPPPPRTVPRDRAVLDDCQAAVGYQFRKPELLKAALTHTSGANTRAASNERLEFLGDSVLGLVTCEELFRRFPEYQEGDLTKVKSVVVSRKTCAAFSQEMGLGDFLFLGKGVGNYGELPSNILADVFESLVAAIFLDGGWDAARDFVKRFVGPEIDRVAQEAVGANAKSQFQHVVQQLYGEAPRYAVLDEQGPDHDKCFKVAAQAAGYQFPPAWGRNKKDAELRAALNGLAEIRGEELPTH
ncbi:ribonuclease III [Urbifossiella limnaea]|uniref:Ribonuclease 3 n=1 Tax=Urbifossiella limnaea TaxID=2528023 RepID=A0A517XSA1_9BACT|nr:ribonuclease III [Urbifossiella limnaea]QDU20363.1 Ribonuclease 3 [Urbifossiella limnaea]